MEQPPNAPIRVLIVDDHELFRKGVQMALEAETDIEAIGEAADHEEAVEAVRSLQPDVVMTDLLHPGASGIETISEVRKTLPNTKIIVCTISNAETDLNDAMAAGADAYISKEMSIDEVAAVIRSVYAGACSSAVTPNHPHPR